MGTKQLVTGACVVGAAIAMATPALAEGDPALNTPCQASNLNETATDPSGAAIRCLANGDGGFKWMADTGAVGTIAQLQKEGFTITIDRVGSGPLDQCKVTNVWGADVQTRTDRSTPGATHPETVTLSKTINVSLDCT